MTMTGVYRLLRHPLYLGTALIYLAYFLAFGDDLLGLELFLAMLGLVYWPRMLAEEQTLQRKFPAQVRQYQLIPRLLPDLRAVPAALDSDCFSLQWAYRNLGIRSLGALLVPPLLLELLIRLKGVR